MATGTHIKVMASSRCNDPIRFKGRDATLSDVRRELKKQIEALRFNSGAVLFTCWINEDESSRAATQDAWDQCLDQVKKADIVICIYNGNAGWATAASGIGICHAELSTAVTTGAVRVRLIEQSPLVIKGLADGNKVEEKHALMKAYVDQQGLFRRTFGTGEELIERALEALSDAVIEMTRLAAVEGRSRRFDQGEALNWSRLSFRERQKAIERVLRNGLSQRAGATRDDTLCFVSVGSGRVLMLCHAIPGAMSVAAAREMVGMPFLHDHQYVGAMKSTICGPVHVIGCHKGVTEAQAMRMLGIPDATFVATSFGVYVADEVQKTQFLLLKNCRDEATTRHAVQRAFDWLSASGEAELLTARAKSRKRIVQAISDEIKTAAHRS